MPPDPGPDIAAMEFGIEAPAELQGWLEVVAPILVMATCC